MFFLDFFHYILYSFIVTYVANRGVAQFGSARGLGPWGREFESLHPDQIIGAFSSVGQSGRLITDWSAVRVREGPPPIHIYILRYGSSVG